MQWQPKAEVRSVSDLALWNDRVVGTLLGGALELLSNVVARELCSGSRRLKGDLRPILRCGRKESDFGELMGQTLGQPLQEFWTDCDKVLGLIEEFESEEFREIRGSVSW